VIKYEGYIVKFVRSKQINIRIRLHAKPTPACFCDVTQVTSPNSSSQKQEQKTAVCGCVSYWDRTDMIFGEESCKGKTTQKKPGLD